MFMSSEEEDRGLVRAPKSVDIYLIVRKGVKLQDVFVHQYGQLKWKNMCT